MAAVDALVVAQIVDDGHKLDDTLNDNHMTCDYIVVYTHVFDKLLKYCTAINCDKIVAAR